MKPKDVDDFFRRLSIARPAPATELNYVNDYTLLVAVVLSAQMTDTGVNKATKDLFTKVTTPQQMIKLGEAKLREHIRGVNYNNTKAKNVIRLSEMLISEFDGTLPRTREELDCLPGVGRKTANVILNVAFGQPTIAVDTHVFRVANRTGLAKGETPHDVEDKLAKIIPKEWITHAHHWLILHGRYTCKARTPLCPECPVRDLCAFKEKTKEKREP